MNHIYQTNSQISIWKLDHLGNKVWRYDGKILIYTQTYVKIEARFNRADLPFHGITFAWNDRFVEMFYFDRWYNIFEIHDRDDDHLKGWYCNVTYPPQLQDDQLSYRDLALDLLVYSDGTQLVLDEEEFSALELSGETQMNARSALTELQHLFNKEINPAFPLLSG